MIGELKIGDNAPEFCLKGAQEKEFCLSDFKGSWVVLYFYPKDNTSGCTREAVDFTEKISELQEENAVVLGVSPDNVKSHERFIEKHGLKITLLSDPDHEVLKRYGVWQKKKMYGREYMGVVRTTFLINPDGKIAHIWRKVKVKGHAEMVLETIKALKESGD